MKTYRIPVWWMVTGHIRVKADDLEEAIEKAWDGSTASVDNPCYIDDSWNVGTEEARDNYKDE